MESEKQIEIMIFGQVQGVFFRQGVKIKADELRITGFVKNLGDDSVKIIAEGKEEKLQELIEWCRKGTEFSEVKDIKIKWLERTGEFKNFEIL